MVGEEVSGESAMMVVMVCPEDDHCVGKRRTVPCSLQIVAETESGA